MARMAAGLEGAARAAGRLVARMAGGRGADLGLAAVVVAVVATLVVPLPAAALDALLAANLVLAVVILAAALQARAALALSAFPTVLLVTTLLRLALEVAAARRILSVGDGGALIRAFGRVVVRGDFVVGAVVFAILTLVQYVVIARGAERVAEVAARFALDALPGRQMAIDAELRAGGLDAREARRRRRELARESQFYGAMDGAMRFVKGDAVAGVVIVLANLAGGAAIGALRRGMTAGRAVEHYGLLAIGQGLAAQIPALVIATAAGVLVTRVASDDPAASLGADVGAQVLGEPRALGVAAAAALALAVAPGLPTLPFAAVGVALGVGAWVAARLGRPAHTDAHDVERAPPAPLALALGRDHAPLAGSDDLARALDAARSSVADALGLALPPVRAAVDPALPGDAVVVLLRGAPVARERLAAGRGAAAVADLAARAARRHAGAFVGVQEAQAMLDALEREAPALVRAAVPRPVSVVLLADVLKLLVEEGVSVRNLRDVLEALARAAEGERDPAVLAERARGALRRELTHRYAPEGALAAWTLDPLIEDVVRDAVRRGGSGALGADLAADVVASVRAALGAGADDAVLVTQGDVRRHVRRALAAELPGVAVVAASELDPAVRLAPRGTVAPVEREPD